VPHYSQQAARKERGHVTREKTPRHRALPKRYFKNRIFTALIKGQLHMLFMQCLSPFPVSLLQTASKASPLSFLRT